MFDLQKFIKAVEEEQLGTYAIIVKENGKVTASHFWRSDLRMNIHSLSKSFVSCAVGIAIEEGLISLEDKVIDFFPEKIDGEASEWLRRLSVFNLLTMCSGHEEAYLMGNQRDELEDEDWVHYYLNIPMTVEPGTKFQYDTACTFIVSAILQKLTGLTVRDYLMPRIFKPLGIRNPQWFASPDGITLGGGGLHLNCEEISRFSELLLNRGSYNGEQLVPAEYIDYASSKLVESRGRGNNACGYGLQFWRCKMDGVYRADGAYGQLAIIFPQQNMTVSITSHNEKNTDRIIDACVSALDNSQL